MHKLCLLLGCASTVWKDAAMAQGMFPDAAVCAVNDIGGYWPWRLDYWVTRHQEILDPLMELRKHRYYNTDYASCSKTSGFGGGSGAEAVVYLLPRAETILLCGMPLDATPRFTSSPFIPDIDHTMYREGFRQITSIYNLKGRVFSISGWTREFFGCNF